ncbi:MAG: Glycosyltransferases involved in cell wall biogenesis [Marinobacter excellens HL-55]|uniref:Glycosyltransferases involved in cell wall biogenesis n=1 Tax=Marinobacter excellens HL-55 TaxID=1305731 RepID=A0A0P7YF52_9GAMM|nr:MAG: Glycosyltransferases involved in cell wall biogenesis [Marinobacter excellens HL-55]
MEKKLVSVIIAAYRAEKTLNRAIDSLKAQTSGSWEAIIVDDNSPDGTYELARRMADSDKRIRAIKLDENGGPSAARNAGINASSGDWVAILDSDDEFSEKRLENFYDFIENNDCGIVFDNICDLAEVTGFKRPYWPHWNNVNEEIKLIEMLQGTCGVFKRNYGVLKPFIKKNELLRTGVFYDLSLRRGEDVNLYLRLMLSGVRVGRIPEIGYFYESSDQVNDDKASLNNLSDSYSGTIKVKIEHWDKMTLSERAWLSVRLARTLMSDDWTTYIDAKKKMDWGRIIVLMLKSSSVRTKVFFGVLAPKMYRLFSKA